MREATAVHTSPSGVKKPVRSHEFDSYRSWVARALRGPGHPQLFRKKKRDTQGTLRGQARATESSVDSNTTSCGNASHSCTSFGTNRGAVQSQVVVRNLCVDPDVPLSIGGSISMSTSS